MSSSSLRDATLKLLRDRPRTLTFKIIARETELGAKWLSTFSQNLYPDPGVCKVEKLYTYLTGKQLEL